MSQKCKALRTVFEQFTAGPRHASDQVLVIIHLNGMSAAGVHTVKSRRELDLTSVMHTANVGVDVCLRPGKLLSLHEFVLV